MKPSPLRRKQRSQSQPQSMNSREDMSAVIARSVSDEAIWRGQCPNGGERLLRFARNDMLIRELAIVTDEVNTLIEYPRIGAVTAVALDKRVRFMLEVLHRTTTERRPNDDRSATICPLPRTLFMQEACLLIRRTEHRSEHRLIRPPGSGLVFMSRHAVLNS